MDMLGEQVLLLSRITLAEGGEAGLSFAVPSLTPVWRACEFQEREVFDLFGVKFEGHPDLRRILMWDEFTAHPMRKDYVEPDDYEWEPTPHGAVLDKAKAHSPASALAGAAPAATAHGALREWQKFKAERATGN